MLRAACVGLVAVASASAAFGALSNNLFNGDFENPAYLKSNYTYDAASNPVGAHRFNRDADYGRWLGFWGLQDLEQNGYYGQGGFSTFDYPRGTGKTMRGVAGVVADDISCNNRSLDPYNPASGNHIMETVAFYPTMSSWVKAPANQMPGPMKFSFDFFLNHWRADTTWNWQDRLEITLYGSNAEPPHNVAIGNSPTGSGGFSMVSPTGGAAQNTTPGYESKMLARFGWGDSWTNQQSWPQTNGWAHVDSAVPTQWWDDVDAADVGSVIVPVSLTETYQYYSVTVSTRIYNEEYYYFIIPGYGVNGWSGTDVGPAIGFDNIDFRVSLVPEPGALAVVGLVGLAMLGRRR